MTDDDLGARFARALAAKDSETLRELLDPNIEFRALTPRKAWEADDAEGVLTILFGSWFEDSDEIRSLEHVESDGFADRRRVGYRMQVDTDGEPYLVEQQAYLSERDGRIDWMRIVCSGFRPVVPAQ